MEIRKVKDNISTLSTYVCTSTPIVGRSEWTQGILRTGVRKYRDMQRHYQGRVLESRVVCILGNGLPACAGIVCRCVFLRFYSLKTNAPGRKQLLGENYLHRIRVRRERKKTGCAQENEEVGAENREHEQRKQS